MKSNNDLEKLKKELEKVEKILDKNRTSTFVDGWQTSRFAKKSKNWDYYSRQKYILRNLIEDLENGE